VAEVVALHSIAPKTMRFAAQVRVFRAKRNESFRSRDVHAALPASSR
jgi:hypothetical protein